MFVMRCILYKCAGACHSSHRASVTRLPPRKFCWFALRPLPLRALRSFTQHMSYAACSTTDCRRQACEAANDAFRGETVYALRKQVTRGILCDTSPPCITELLFEHEFWLKPGRGFKNRAVALQRCSTWQRDSDWPTAEPHLVRETRFRGFWSALRQLPNRTIWVHGDSIQMQLFSAALCSLLRGGKLRTPVYARRPRWVDELSKASGLNLFYTEAVNGALPHARDGGCCPERQRLQP